MLRKKVVKLGAITGFILITGAILSESLIFPASFSGGFNTSAQTVSGGALFKANCARCHGDDATGGKGPNLTTEKKRAKWKDSDEKIVKKITNGGFGMPKFGKKLRPEEIKAIAEYVRALK